MKPFVEFAVGTSDGLWRSETIPCDFYNRAHMPEDRAVALLMARGKIQRDEQISFVHVIRYFEDASETASAE